MLVETYEVEEIKGEAGVMAADSESIEIIEKLELEGQKSLVDTKTATRMPYRELTLQEKNIFQILCPHRVKLEEYSRGPIPLRVLQVASHAKELGMFKGGLWVLCPTSTADLDPVLVGSKNGDPYTPLDCLLARWGDTLEPLDVLAEKAQKIWVVMAAQAVRKVKRDVEEYENNLETNAVRAFSQNAIALPSASFYVNIV